MVLPGGGGLQHVLMGMKFCWHGCMVIDVDANVPLVCGDVVVALCGVFEAVCDERSCS